MTAYPGKHHATDLQVHTRHTCIDRLVFHSYFLARIETAYPDKPSVRDSTGKKKSLSLPILIFSAITPNIILDPKI